MERRSRISMDNPAFRGRLRASPYVASSSSARTMREVHNAQIVPVDSPEKTTPASIDEPSRPLLQPSMSPLPRITTHTTALAPQVNKSKVHLPRQLRSNVLKRQTVRLSAKKYRPKHRRPLMPTLLSGLAVVLFTAGVFVVFNSLKADHTVKAQDRQLSKQTDSNANSSAPSEDDPPTNVDLYNVAPDMPKLLTIEKIGVNARIRRLGVDSNSMPKAPANIFDVGWYDGSAKPGENGTVVLDGHVSGATKRGVFYSLGSLKNGDKVQLERGDGKKFNYTVTGTQVYDNDKVDMAKVMASSVPGKPALNFMTFTGRFNVRTNSFEQRVVVFTVQDS